jgi:hypothetical protein
VGAYGKGNARERSPARHGASRVGGGYRGRSGRASITSRCCVQWNGVEVQVEVQVQTGAGCWYAVAVGLRQFQRRALGWTGLRC